MNLSKTGKNSVRWVLDLPEPCIHTRTNTHTHSLSLSHTHTHTHNNQRYCSSFLKGKDKYNTLSGSSAVRYANTQSSSRMRYTRWQAFWIEPHSGEVVQPPESGFQSSLVWPALHGGGGGGGSTCEEWGEENCKQPGSSDYWMWSTKGARPNKQCLNATFCNLRISSVTCARLCIRSIEGNQT